MIVVGREVIEEISKAEVIQLKNGKRKKRMNKDNEWYIPYILIALVN